MRIQQISDLTLSTCWVSVTSKRPFRVHCGTLGSFLIHLTATQTLLEFGAKLQT